MHAVTDIEELRALARAVALDEGLDLQLGEPGSGWFINPKTGIINVDGGDLAGQTADDSRGLICHEAAHAAVTRYLHLMPLHILKRPGIASLMNSLEDCRIEEWLKIRFPGSGEWIDLYNNRLFPDDAKGLEQQPWFQQFCLGAIHEWWHGELPPNLHDAPAEALETTREARQRIIAAQPPHDADVDLAAAFAYNGSPVEELFRRRDRFVPPDTFEKLVRLTAFIAYRITWLEIRPIYEDLIRRDKDHASQMKSAEQRFLRQLRELRFGSPMRRKGGRSVPIPISLRPGGAPLGPSAGRPSGGLADVPEHLRRAIDDIVNAPPENQYEEARRDVAPLADRLVASLERLLRPTSYPRWLPGYPSGSRVDLRVAMSMEVEPGAYTRMWQRKTLPSKRDPGILLLLDLSGSMAGGPIHNCFRGTVLVAEVLQRLQIPFAVYGFQDVLIPFKDFGAPLDEATRLRIGDMPAEVTGNRKGGHNRPQHNYDGPVLLSARDALLDYPAHTPILLSVSDGEPSGPSDADGALRRAVARVVKDVTLIGIGLGPGTDHVARFYPDHIANVPLERFPEALARVMHRLIAQPAGNARRSGARA